MFLKFSYLKFLMIFFIFKILNLKTKMIPTYLK